MLRTTLATLAVSLAATLVVGVAVASGPTGPPTLLKPAALRAKAPAKFTVAFTTTKGTFDVAVQRSLAPRGADRFYNLVQAKFFDGVKFFRVVPGFVVQFGISGNPAVAAAWSPAYIADDAVKGTNARGTIVFATAGANTRTTQVFVNLKDNTFLDTMGFAPFGSVTKGMKVVDKLYGGYGDQTTPLQGQIETGGNAFLKAQFPKLDGIVTARVVSP